MIQWYLEATLERSPWEASRPKKRVPVARVAEAFAQGLLVVSNNLDASTAEMLRPARGWTSVLSKDGLPWVLTETPAELLAAALAAAQPLPGTELVEVLGSVAEPARVVELLLRRLGWRMEPRDPPSRGPAQWALVPEDPIALRQRVLQELVVWKQLRRRLLALPPAERQRLDAEIAPFLAGLESERRTLGWWLMPWLSAEAEVDRVLKEADDPAQPWDDGFGLMMLGTQLSPASAATLWGQVTRRPGWSGCAERFGFDAVASLGEDALPGVQALWEEAVQAEFPVYGSVDSRRRARLYALFSESGPELASRVEHPVVGGVATETFRRRPDMAVSCLGASLAQRGRLPQKQAEILVALCRVNPEGVRGAMMGQEARLVARLQNLLGGQREEAEPEELPQVLRDPPWRKKGLFDGWPSLPPRPLEDFALLALRARNRPDDRSLGDAYFQEPLKSPDRKGPADRGGRRRPTEPVWRRDRFRQLVDILVCPNEERGLALGLMRYILAAEPVLRAELSAEEAAVVDSLLDRDPLSDCPAKIAKLPPFCELAALPRPHLRSGRVLSLSATQAVVELWSFTPRNQPHVGLAQLREALDPSSLEELAWALATAWAEGPNTATSATTAWAMYSLVYGGGEGVARRLAPYLRRLLLREPRVKPVLVGLDCLAMIGSDVALMHLGTFLKAREEDVRRQAELLLEQVAQRQGLSPEEMEERLIPDLELERDGTTTLDFGPRAFQVRFDEHLEPQLWQDGERVRAIPRPSRTDDAEKAAAAVERWKGLKGDARTLVSQLRRRLEAAMVQRRTWTTRAFQSLMLGHPLLSLLSRRLVWGQSDGSRWQVFRIAEDGSLADSDDRHFEIPDQARLGLPHALEIPERERWAEILADYHVLQPFPQVGRELYTALPEEQNATTMKELPTGKLGWHMLRATLEGRGWELIWGTGFVRRIREGRATIQLTGMGKDEECALTQVGFDQRIREINPVFYSEVRRDIQVFNR